MNSIQVVMLDYGLVLCRKPIQEDIDRLTGVFGISEVEFWRLYEKNRQAYDKGEITPVDYWTRFGLDSGVQPESLNFQFLMDLDIQMWGVLEHALFRWVEHLRESGYKTALLSNMHLRFAQYVRRNCPWVQLFDYQFFSAELRLVKPDRRIYEAALGKIAIAPSEILFIDDRPANISAARALGLKGLVYSSPAQLNADLQLGGFPRLLSHA